MESKIFNEVKNRLKVATKRNSAEGILFSGGLDTSILTAISPELTAIHISLENYGSDFKYAKKVEKFLHLRVYYQKIKTEDAIKAIPETIKILKSFDPAIPNDIPVYFGLKFAKELGLKSIMTGDGADELFAGYNYMKHLDNLDTYIQKITKNMYFNSNELGKFFAIEIKQPYIDREFAKFLIDEVPLELKLRKYRGKFWGKWVLRKAFEDVLPAEIIWQNKRPLEYGSGMTMLRKIISEKISNNEFNKKQKIYPVKFINKEHMYYYEIYRKIFREIPVLTKNQIHCPGCAAEIEKEALHCRVCGWVKRIS